MTLKDIKNLVTKLEAAGVTEDFNLTFRANLTNETSQGLDIADFEIENSARPFDIGHSDKSVGIFIEEVW